MNYTLKNHPFAVEAFFKHSIVLTFALPKEELISSIPSALKLDTYNDQYGFVSVALVDTKSLRPKGFPKFLGNDFFLIAIGFLYVIPIKPAKIYEVYTF